jgi:hypothetical protein
VIFTDKRESGLIARYEERFAELANKPISYLEVGIGKGGSLEWASWFFHNPHALIIGVDIHIPRVKIPNVTMCRGDQDDPPGLSLLGLRYGPFDLVIDDASHLPRQTYNTFQALWPWVKKGGWYCVEDWNSPWTHGAYFEGVQNVVTSIVLLKKQLGIGELAIHVYPNLHSQAFYRKLEEAK